MPAPDTVHRAFILAADTPLCDAARPTPAPCSRGFPGQRACRALPGRQRSWAASRSVPGCALAQRPVAGGVSAVILEQLHPGRFIDRGEGSSLDRPSSVGQPSLSTSAESRSPPKMPVKMGLGRLGHGPSVSGPYSRIQATTPYAKRRGILLSYGRDSVPFGFHRGVASALLAAEA